MNEEDLKNKIILPYIKSLGIGADEIKFEKSFDVVLGKSSYKKKKNELVENAGGRSDILCKKGDMNLFIVEVKSDEVEIDNNDVDQGISYARLVHPIAPFVLVTNGKETRVVDTITKEELKGTAIKTNFWNSGCQLETEIELKIRYEALKNFVSYSPQNLSLFSRSQVDGRMQPLRGDIDHLNKKYVPELYFDKPELKVLFKEFLNSGSQCFAIVGEAGVGKTNIICALTESVINDHVVLFFNVADMVGSIVSNIDADFNWMFSSKLEEVEIFRMLDALLNKASKQKICIFFDAIDEHTSSDFNLELNDFIRKAKGFPEVKICISCKSTEWGKFLQHNGNPTQLAESIYKPPIESSVNEKQQKDQREYSVFLQRFSDPELEDLENLYKKVFHFTGTLSGNVRNECRLGFMLRVVSEVYGGKELPAVIDGLELLNTFLEKKFEKMDKELCRNCIVEIGNALFESDKERTDKFDFMPVDRIEESQLRKRLNMSVTEKIPDELFAYNILTRIEYEKSSYIGFYYGRMRDYVISILSLKLHIMDDTAFRNVLPSMFKGSISQSALSWHCSFASRNQLDIVNQYYQAKALVFLDEYNRIIESQFPNLKDRFEPYCQGNVGIAITELSDGSIGQFGFRALPSSSESKILVLHGGFEHEFFNHGVHTVYYMRSFHIDPFKAAKEIVVEQVTKIVEKGMLNENNNVDLALEKITSIAHCFSDKLGLNKSKKTGWLTDFKDILPLTCDDLERRIQLFYAKIYCEREYIQEKIRSGEIKTERHGTGVFFSTGPNNIDYAEVERRAIKAIESGTVFQEPDISGSFPPFAVLSEALKTYKTQHNSITEPLLPSPDVPSNEVNDKVIKNGGNINWIPDILVAYYADARLEEYLKKFFSLFLREYLILIETCFPVMKNKFLLYSLNPVNIDIEVNTKGNGRWGLHYRMTKSNDVTDITVAINPTLSKFDNWKSFGFGCSQELSTIFHSYDTLPLTRRNIWGLNKVQEMCVLRSWVYKRIKNELKNAMKNF